MTSFPEVSDLPDTWSYPTEPARNSGPGTSQLRCGCTPEEGCRSCSGEGIAEWTDRKRAVEAVREAWRRGDLTAEQYYHRSAAADPDGLPAREAVRARERAAWRGRDPRWRELHGLDEPQDGAA